MKSRTIIYSAYLIASILVSILIASLPSIILFLMAYQNIDTLIAAHGGLLAELPTLFRNTFGDLLPTVFYERVWFIILLPPIIFFCYGLFLVILGLMFRLARHAIPRLADGYYSKESEDWLIYEFYEAYYVLYPYFAWLFTVFFDTKPRHWLFGAKIGRGTIIGNGRLFNPERTIIGENCFFGYNAILSGHVYEGNKLYLKTVRLGNNVTVGANAVILPGADIGDNVIIGANTTVPKDRLIPSNSIWVNGKAIPRRGAAVDLPVTVVLDHGVVMDSESPDDKSNKSF